MTAIQTAAKFIAGLPEDDRDLQWLRYVDADGDRVLFGEEPSDLIGRFGMDPGAWNTGPPNEVQIRKLLRRMDGAESRERAAQRRDLSQ